MSLFMSSLIRMTWVCLCVTSFGGCRPHVDTPPEVTAKPENATLSLSPIEVSSGDWPWWRGPGYNNQPAERAGRLSYAITDVSTILWQVDLPGKGRSTPIVLNNVIYLSTGIQEENQSQAVLAFDAESGDQLWKTVVHTGGFDPKVDPENSQASPTMSTDGERLFCVFMSHGDVQLSALDFGGKVLWTKSAGSYLSKFGYGTSPLVYGNAVYLAVDHEQGGFLTAMRRDNGETLWLKQRPKVTNFSIPVLAELGSRPQILLTGGHRIMSYDANTGELVWEIKGLSETMVGTPLILRDEDGKGLRFIGSGGYPEDETVAIDLTASPPKTIWTNKDKLYIPSPAVSDDGQTMYGVDDRGMEHGNGQAVVEETSRWRLQCLAPTCRRSDAGGQ